MQNFNELGLPDSIVQALIKMNFTKPTPIQAQAIPLAMSGRDVLGSAQTGTGKTGAFSIPLIANLIANPNATALVLTPTRELAVQVIDIMKQLLGTYNIKAALLIGGESMPRQVSELRAMPKPRLIVGTPGRVFDHLERGNLMLNKASFLVLDETDKMLDMGFEIQIDKIARYLPANRQTLMFSATMPEKIIKMSAKYLNNPERITIGSVTAPIARIKQEIIHTTAEQKYSHLTAQLKKREGSIIVFVKTKRGADKLATKLCREKHSADAIHGDLNQNARQRVIDAFRNRKHRIMIATDVAARGLDISHIEHVINYDLPQVPEDYIHRIGRTGRAGAEGAALCLITPDDADKWKAINKMLNPNQSSGNQSSDDSQNKSSNKNSNQNRNKNINQGASNRPAPKHNHQNKNNNSNNNLGNNSGKPAQSNNAQAKPAHAKPEQAKSNVRSFGFLKERFADKAA